LTDGVVGLRLSAEGDIPEILIAYQDDPRLHLSLGTERPPSGAQLGRRQEQAEARRAAGELVSLTVLEAESEVCRGQIDVHAVDWENRRAELAVWVAPRVRGRGLGRRALALAGRWLLSDCGLERAGLLVDPSNGALLRAAHAAGFKDEGVLRAYALAQGKRVDRAALSLVRGDLSG
jgi:RimJ/RimL family protein N-acetyltransferase